MSAGSASWILQILQATYMVLKKRPLSGNTYKLPLYFIVISEDFILQMDVHLVWPHSKCEANIISFTFKGENDPLSNKED